MNLISDIEVRNKIDEAEQSLIECYDILRNFHSPNETNPKALIFDFQPKLAECLYSLMVFYQKLHQEAKNLISNKHSFVDTDFRQHMKTNAAYKRAISEVIKMGKALGDAFAWFFFCDNREELEKHIQHQSTGLFTNGIGGLGEVEFIKNHQVIDGLLVIYHGITNMLKIGDFSLYAYNKGIVGNGELKTKKENDTLVINASILTKIPPNILSKAEGITSQEIEREFPRLKKQLQQQTALLKTQKNPNILNGLSDYEYSIINKLCGEETLVFNEDCTLALVAIRHKGCSLSDRLLCNKNTTVDFNTEIKEIHNRLLDPQSKNNCMITSYLDTVPSNTRIPVFWWDIDDDLCKSVYFDAVTIVTIFNPARLLSLFEKDGYTVHNGQTPSETYLTKIEDKTKLELHSIEMVYNLISQNLMKTNDAFECTKSFLDLRKTGKIPLNSRVEMRLSLSNFGAPHTDVDIK